MKSQAREPANEEKFGHSKYFLHRTDRDVRELKSQECTVSECHPQVETELQKQHTGLKDDQ